MASETAILFVLELLSDQWPSFVINQAVDSTDPLSRKYGTIKIWLRMFADMDDDKMVMGAAIDLVAKGGQFPPKIGEIRRRVVEMSMGEVVPMSGDEAWSEVQRFVTEFGKGEARPADKLSGLICDAVEAAGGWYQVRSSENPEFIRSAFVKSYNSIRGRKIELSLTMPEVRALAERNLPALPAPGEQKQLPEPQLATPDEVSALVAQVINKDESQKQ